MVGTELLRLVVGIVITRGECRSSQCSNLSLLQLPQSPDGGPDAGSSHCGVVPGPSSHIDTAVLIVAVPHANSLDEREELSLSY